ncbi:MAG: hypothetical protein RSB71_04455 [Bacilli bacterium]
MSMPIILSKKITRYQSIADIIESLANEETSIAHILNAESEKIEKTIINGTYEEILAVNKSVHDMLKSINRLEQILKNKLDLFSNSICLIT